MFHMGLRQNPSVYVRLVGSTVADGMNVMRMLGYRPDSGKKTPEGRGPLPIYRVGRKNVTKVFDALRWHGIIYWA